MISFISIEQSFDAWGRKRNPADWTYESIPATNLLYRGYTFHEHLDEFGLINMNGRAYDPIVGRFLNPDPVLQNPSDIQNYNRYSYCLNNPLKYTDPSGYRWSPIGDIHLHQLNLMANSMREAKMDLQDKIRFWTTGSSVSLIGVAKHEGPKGNNADGNVSYPIVLTGMAAKIASILKKCELLASEPDACSFDPEDSTVPESGQAIVEVGDKNPTVTNCSDKWTYVLTECNANYQIVAVPPNGKYYDPIDGVATFRYDKYVFKVPDNGAVTILPNGDVDLDFIFFGDLLAASGIKAGWKDIFYFSPDDLNVNGWQDLFNALQTY